jgi:hypothetical protein
LTCTSSGVTAVAHRFLTLERLRHWLGCFPRNPTEAASRQWEATGCGCCGRPRQQAPEQPSARHSARQPPPPRAPDASLPSLSYRHKLTGSARPSATWHEAAAPPNQEPAGAASHAKRRNHPTRTTPEQPDRAPVVGPSAMRVWGGRRPGLGVVGWGQVAQGAVRADSVVLDPPVLDQHLGLQQGGEGLDGQQLVAHRLPKLPHRGFARRAGLDVAGSGAGKATPITQSSGVMEGR